MFVDCDLPEQRRNTRGRRSIGRFAFLVVVAAAAAAAAAAVVVFCDCFIIIRCG